ncbi:hypothetical protein AMECASPLE_038648 [Ameca splendens]|uniref:Uncharacterized protein n=1 Tax=Ameca splendens TaxID=208324 RepID=A0ABV0XXM5_9TELE
MRREGLGGKMLSQGASSPADPNRQPRSPSSNKGQRAPPHKQYSKPHDAPPRPPPCPSERRQPSKQKGSTERAQHAQQRGRTAPRDAKPPTSTPAKQKRQSQAKLRFPPSQSYSNTTHPSIHR